MEDFAYHLKKIRESRGFTVNQLAMYSKISSASISRYESGERKPKPENIKKLSEALRFPYNDLMKLAGNYMGDDNQEDEQNNKKAMADKLLHYLDQDLTNDEIKKRMDFMFDVMNLNNSQVDEFIDFVKWQLSRKKEQPAASKSEEP